MKHLIGLIKAPKDKIAIFGQDIFGQRYRS
nr:hypothetical protein [Desulforamulus aquiferis]